MQKYITARSIISMNTRFNTHNAQIAHSVKISIGQYRLVEWGTDRYVPQWRMGKAHDPLSETAQLIIMTVKNSGANGITKHMLEYQTGIPYDRLDESVRELSKMNFFTIKAMP